MDGLRKNYEWFEVFYGRLLCEEGVCIVINCNHVDYEACVAHVARLNYEVFECVHVHPYPFYVIKFDYLLKGEF